MNNRYFNIGLVLYYLITFFAPNKPVLMGAFFIALVFFYLATKNIRNSLVFGLVLSVFSEVSIGGSFFQLEPQELRLGSGFSLMPLLLFLILLLILSFKENFKCTQADIFVILFFFSSVVSSLVFPNKNVFLGLLTLSHIVIFYYLSRINLNKENIKYVVFIFISVLTFQSLLSIQQAIIGRPIGTLSETVSYSTPYGYTTSEESSLFRSSATYSHPNFLASFLITFFPFALFYPSTHILFSLVRAIVTVSIILTMSRAAWIFTGLLMIFWLIRLLISEKFRLSRLVKKNFHQMIIYIVVFVIFFPLLWLRMSSIQEAIEEQGSFDTRVKLFKEGIALVSQSPLFGVGFNQSLVLYAYNPVTDIFQTRLPSAFYKIHNTFMEIGSEIGIPGLIFFLLFLLLVVLKISKEKKDITKLSAFWGLIMLIGISNLNPFFHSSQFILFFLLSAIILI